MSQVNLKAVQKILNLDVLYPSFSTWTETLEFVVDGVSVKALVYYAWRRTTIQIIEPFNIQAWIFEPPLIALGVSMLHRQESLELKRLTETEDCTNKARSAYLEHLAYIKIKPKIDAAQNEVFRLFENEMKTLLLESESVRNLIIQMKQEAKIKFRSGAITQKEYQSTLKILELEAKEAYQPYSQLKDQVDRRLSKIRQSMMNKICKNEL